MDDSFSIVGAFLVEPRLKLYYKGQFLLNLTIVYYVLILIRIGLRSNFSRFLLAQNINCWNQTLVLDDDVTKHLSKIRASSLESKYPHHEKASKIFFAVWTRLEVAVARPEHQTTSNHFIFGLSANKMVVFVVVACACPVVTRDSVTGSAKQLCSWLIQQSSRMMHGIRAMMALVFLFCLQVLFCMFCCWSHVHCRRSGAQICSICLRFPVFSVSFLRLLSLRCSNWCSCDDNCRCGMSIVMIFTTLSQCSCCICQQGCLVVLRLIATAFLVVVERLVLWALWRLTMMVLIAWSAMVLIASIAIGHVDVDCCCLSQLRLAPMLTLHSQLHLSLVY